MEVLRQLVVFSLNDRHYALHLSAVERIVPVVKITVWPRAPEIVLGVVNIAGRLVPALDIRKRFRLPQRDISLSDHMIIARTSRRPVALIVDAAVAVIERSRSEITAAERILPSAEYVEGVAKLDDGLILIHDLDTFLSPVEERDLEHAMTPT
jgi:purine-binding chemotaxis protein CheW